MTRIYEPVASLSPERLEIRREKERAKCRRLRAADPERHRAIGREFYARNPDRYLDRKKEWRKSNPEKVRAGKLAYWKNKRARYIVQMVRAEAKKKCVKFDISVEWVETRLARGICELSGLPFNLDTTDDRKNMPSIDRRIPFGDYVESNCRLILFGLNSLLRRSGDAGVPRAVARIHELRAAG